MKLLVSLPQRSCAIAFALLWLLVIRQLPSVDGLRAYEPPLPTNVRGNDGAPIHSYARERRVELSYAEYPPLMVDAFLSAEDKNFFEHHGVDYGGVARAAYQGIVHGSTPRGTSTITQQVAKNLLVGNEASYSRKLKEAILAYKIENALTKQQILELYLNQIALGRNAFGVEAASHAYFDKELPELDPRAICLSSDPAEGAVELRPVPAYRPRAGAAALRARGNAQEQASSIRRNMRRRMPHRSARCCARRPSSRRSAAISSRRCADELIDKFGETANDGPFSVYSGGLWVRTSLDTRLQDLAAQALRDGLIRYDRGRGWNGPIRHTSTSATTIGCRCCSTPISGSIIRIGARRS